MYVLVILGYLLTDFFFFFSTAKREGILMPYLGVLSSFRDHVRQLAIRKGDTALKDILALCDKLRDSDLVPLGVALDDQEGGFAIIYKLSIPLPCWNLTRW